MDLCAASGQIPSSSIGLSDGQLPDWSQATEINARGIQSDTLYRLDIVSLPQYTRMAPRPYLGVMSLSCLLVLGIISGPRYIAGELKSYAE